MKIGIDIRLIGKQRTGDEVVFLNLVKNLAKIDTNNQYVLFADSQQKEQESLVAERLEIKDAKNFSITFLETSNKFLWNFWFLPRYLKKNPIDIYHTQYITPFFVSKKIKIVTIVHDISFNFFPQFIKFFDLLFLKILIPLSLRRADKIIGVSKFTRDEIIKYYKIDASKVEYVYNALGEEFLRNDFSAKQLNAVREKYSLPTKFILYLGTLQPRKNVGHLIETFARIKDRLGETKLVICGNMSAHNCDKQIQKNITKLKLENEVIFPGFVDQQDKVAIFSLAHVFAFPSLYEGFGIPPLEAMSQKVPVICSDIASLREVAGQGVLFFDTQNLDDFAKKLYDISMDDELRSKLIQSGFSQIELFCWKKSAQKMLAIYGDLMHN
ncbi:MAG: glycosyltransferase family 1 protein [bacterium]